MRQRQHYGAEKKMATPQPKPAHTPYKTTPHCCDRRCGKCDNKQTRKCQLRMIAPTKKAHNGDIGNKQHGKGEGEGNTIHFPRKSSLCTALHCTARTAVARAAAPPAVGPAVGPPTARARERRGPASPCGPAAWRFLPALPHPYAHTKSPKPNTQHHRPRAIARARLLTRTHAPKSLHLQSGLCLSVLCHQLQNAPVELRC